MDSLRKQTRNRNILRIGVCCRDAAVVLLSFGRGKSKRLENVQSFTTQERSKCSGLENIQSFVTPNLERKGKDIYPPKKHYPQKTLFSRRRFRPALAITSKTMFLHSLRHYGVIKQIQSTFTPAPKGGVYGKH